MAEKIPQHTHCTMCGKTIPITEIVCSEECKGKYERVIRRKKLLFWMMNALVIVFIIIIILSATAPQA